MNLFNTLPAWLNNLLAVAGWIAALGIYFFSQVRKEADEQRTALIDALQQRLDLLEQSTKETEAKLDHLTQENGFLKDLILQRDPDEKEFRDKQAKAIERIDFLYQNALIAASANPKGRRAA